MKPTNKFYEINARSLELLESGYYNKRCKSFFYDFNFILHLLPKDSNDLVKLYFPKRHD